MVPLSERINALLKNKKAFSWILLSGALLLCAVAFIPRQASDTTDVSVQITQPGTQEYTVFSSVEQRLRSALAQIDGAGTVEVLITYKTTSKLVPAKQTSSLDTSASGGGYEHREEIILISGSGGTQALILGEEAPEVLGVVVIAEGAADLTVRLNLQSAVQTALQLDASRIEVLPMGK